MRRLCYNLFVVASLSGLLSQSAFGQLPGTFVPISVGVSGAAGDCTVTGTGNTVSQTYNTTIYTFINSGTLVCGGSKTASLLVAAGGAGGGGNVYPGGGGAGGLCQQSNRVINGTIQVTIGAHGNGGPSNGSASGTNGSNSVFDSSGTPVTAIGGGGGGRGGAVNINGTAGGSGGGATANSGTGGSATQTTPSGGATCSGFAGGNSSGTSTGSGGGGSGGLGGNGDSTANQAAGAVGGAGTVSSITGTAVMYAAGGHGAGNTANGVSGINCGDGGNGGGTSSTAGGNGHDGCVIVSHPGGTGGPPPTCTANTQGGGTYANVKGLWHFDNNGNDGSGTPHALTLNGSAAYSATQSKFGGYSLNIVTATTSFAQIAAGISGLQDLTYEAWFYMPSTVTGNWGWIGDDNTTAFGAYATPTISMQMNSSVSTSVTMSLFGSGAWHHAAWIRQSGQFYFYFDGVLQAGSGGSTGVVVAGNGTTPWKIGRTTATTYVMQSGSYIDEVRISNIARYTFNFTPQTTPFCDN